MESAMLWCFVRIFTMVVRQDPSFVDFTLDLVRSSQVLAPILKHFETQFLFIIFHHRFATSLFLCSGRGGNSWRALVAVPNGQSCAWYPNVRFYSSSRFCVRDNLWWWPAAPSSLLLRTEHFYDIFSSSLAASFVVHLISDVSFFKLLSIAILLPTCHPCICCQSGFLGQCPRLLLPRRQTAARRATWRRYGCFCGGFVGPVDSAIQGRGW